MSELIAGQNYEAVLKEEEVGRVLYLGTSYKNYIRWHQNRHGVVRIIAFKNKVGGIECWRFDQYELLNGKLKINFPLRQKISTLERKFIEDQLNRNNQ
jgi:hypothetical protein